MSPETLTTKKITNNDQRVSLEQSSDPYFLSLPLSNEGHVIEGGIDDIIQDPNAITGLSTAYESIYEHLGCDPESIANNIERHSSYAQKLQSKLIVPEDLEAKARKRANDEARKARKQLQSTLESVSSMYNNLQEYGALQPSPAPVVVFSAEGENH